MWVRREWWERAKSLDGKDWAAGTCNWEGTSRMGWAVLPEPDKPEMETMTSSLSALQKFPVRFTRVRIRNGSMP